MEPGGLLTVVPGTALPCRPSRVFLYVDPAAPEIDSQAVGRYLDQTTGVPVEVRKEFVSYHRGDLGPLAEAFAAARVTDPSQPWKPFQLPLGVVQVEMRSQQDPGRIVPGILYDGVEVMRILRSLLPSGESHLDDLHIVSTRRLLGTFDEGDRRYHARTIVLGYPCLLSTSGLVEAPAKPREFYLRRRASSALGMEIPVEALKADLGDRFLDYGDPRTTEVAKGYALQAFAYHALGEPFCEDPDCRLFNAHWQEEMLRAQVSSGAICKRHTSLLGKR